MPNDAARSKEVLRFLAEEISPNTYVNVMTNTGPAERRRRTRRSTAGSRPRNSSGPGLAGKAGLTRLDSRQRARHMLFH